MDSRASSRAESSSSSFNYRQRDRDSIGFDSGIEENLCNNRSIYSGSSLSNYSRSRYQHNRYNDDQVDDTNTESVATNIELGDYHSFQPFSQIKNYTDDEDNAQTFSAATYDGFFENNHDSSFSKFDMLNNEFFRENTRTNDENYHRYNEPLVSESDTTREQSNFDNVALQCYMDEQTALEYPETPQKLQKNRNRQVFDELYFQKCVKTIHSPMLEDNFDEDPMDLTLGMPDNHENTPMDMTCVDSSDVDVNLSMH